MAYGSRKNKKANQAGRADLPGSHRCHDSDGSCQACGRQSTSVPGIANQAIPVIPVIPAQAGTQCLALWMGRMSLHPACAGSAFQQPNGHDESVMTNTKAP
jgi:hypothetical protein